MTPRPYQDRALASARQCFAHGAKAVVVVSPTGSGKTCMGAMIAQGHLQRPDRRVVWLAHRSELIDQAARTLHEFGIEVGVRGASPSAAVQVESVQTILARGTSPDGTLLIPDECHHFAASNRCGDIVKMYPRILGLTATPERGDGEPMKPPFDALVVAAQISELQALWRATGGAQGLVPLRIKWPGKALSKKTLAARPVDWYIEHAMGRRAICFAGNLKIAETFRDDFVSLGVRAALIKGSLDDDTRATLLAEHRAGKLDVLVNVGVLTEGYDDPAVSCIIMGRGCGSQGFLLQTVGRGLRPAPGKLDCLFLDLRGVSADLGRPDVDRDFSLDGDPITVKDRDPRNAARLCRSCKAPLGDLVTCPECGFETPLPVYSNLPAVDFDAAKADALRLTGASKMVRALAGMLRKAERNTLDGAIRAKFQAIFRFVPGEKQVREAVAYNKALRGAIANQERAIEADDRFNEADESGWAVR